MGFFLESKGTWDWGNGRDGKTVHSEQDSRFREAAFRFLYFFWALCFHFSQFWILIWLLLENTPWWKITS